MYKANEERYENMKYVRCGKSGVLIPRIALGFWHNFGSVDNFENQKAMVRKAFDLGITHFDLANNYGPVYGSAEENFGKIMDSDMRPYRDEMLIATKAGYDMWKGPYGDGGSRKYLMASLDQSLKRMRLDYVDIFYHHRPDPNTPLEETARALDGIVRSGKPWRLCQTLSVRERLFMWEFPITMQSRQGKRPGFFPGTIRPF